MRKLLNELSINTYTLSGPVAFDTTSVTFKSITDSIRSIKGVISARYEPDLRVQDSPFEQDRRRIGTLTVRFTNFPFVGGKGEGFNIERVDEIVNMIRRIRGVRYWKAEPSQIRRE